MPLQTGSQTGPQTGRQTGRQRASTLLSPAGRERDLAAMTAEAVDVLVVGGGITGAGVARDAALRGLATALVERADFASGTSSRSSKLIHGGVRYLQQGDVALVVEAAEERRILRRIAPHLTQPRPMMVPTYGRGTHTKLGVGLWTYEKIARIPPAERHRMLDRDAALAEEPGLCPEGLTGAAVYPENLTDDARLVLATLRSAKGAGALVANHVAVEALAAEGGGFRARLRDGETGALREVRARVVVNAAGPWCDVVRALEGPLDGKRLHLTKGIHVVVRHEDLPIRSMIVMQARDRRAVFAIPRGEIVYVGTTDTDYGATDDYPRITRDDVDYLLDAVRRVFPAASWGAERVLGAWAGLRPLIHEEGKAPSEISRKDEILVGAHGMVSVAGGKLTTYRAMAQKVVDRVEERLGRRPSEARTAAGPLEGGDLPGGADPAAFALSLAARFEERIGGARSLVDRLVLHYGGGAESVLEQAAASGGRRLGSGAVLAAEVERAVDGEMALRLADVIERRLRLLPFDPLQGLDVAEEAAAIVAARLGWDEARTARELEDYRRIAESCRPA